MANEDETLDSLAEELANNAFLMDDPMSSEWEDIKYYITYNPAGVRKYLQTWSAYYGEKAEMEAACQRVSPIRGESLEQVARDMQKHADDAIAAWDRLTAKYSFEEIARSDMLRVES